MPVYPLSTVLKMSPQCQLTDKELENSTAWVVTVKALFVLTVSAEFFLDFWTAWWVSTTLPTIVIVYFCQVNLFCFRRPDTRRPWNLEPVVTSVKSLICQLKKPVIVVVWLPDFHAVQTLFIEPGAPPKFKFLMLIVLIRKHGSWGL